MPTSKKSPLARARALWDDRLPGWHRPYVRWAGVPVLLLAGFAIVTWLGNQRSAVVAERATDVVVELRAPLRDAASHMKSIASRAAAGRDGVLSISRRVATVSAATRRARSSAAREASATQLMALTDSLQRMVGELNQLVSSARVTSIRASAHASRAAGVARDRGALGEVAELAGLALEQTGMAMSMAASAQRRAVSLFGPGGGASPDSLAMLQRDVQLATSALSQTRSLLASADSVRERAGQTGEGSRVHPAVRGLFDSDDPRSAFYPTLVGVAVVCLLLGVSAVLMAAARSMATPLDSGLVTEQAGRFERTVAAVARVAPVAAAPLLLAVPAAMYSTSPSSAYQRGPVTTTTTTTRGNTAIDRSSVVNHHIGNVQVTSGTPDSVSAALGAALAELRGALLAAQARSEAARIELARISAEHQETTQQQLGLTRQVVARASNGTRDAIDSFGIYARAADGRLDKALAAQGALVTRAVDSASRQTQTAVAAVESLATVLAAGQQRIDTAAKIARTAAWVEPCRQIVNADLSFIGRLAGRDQRHVARIVKSALTNGGVDRLQDPELILQLCRHVPR